MPMSVGTRCLLTVREAGVLILILLPIELLLLLVLLTGLSWPARILNEIIEARQLIWYVGEIIMAFHGDLDIRLETIESRGGVSEVKKGEIEVSEVVIGGEFDRVCGDWIAKREFESANYH